MEIIEIVNFVVGMLLMLLAIGLALQISSYLEIRKGVTAGKYNDWYIILILPFTPIFAIGSMFGATQYFLKKKEKEIMQSVIVGVLAWSFVIVNLWKS